MVMMGDNVDLAAALAFANQVESLWTFIEGSKDQVAQSIQPTSNRVSLTVRPLPHTDVAFGILHTWLHIHLSPK